MFPIQSKQNYKDFGKKAFTKWPEIIIDNKRIYCLQ